MKPTIKILLLEDDSLQFRDAVEHLESAFNGPIQTLKTESDLVRQLPRIIEDPPDVFIIDVNLRWSDPLPEMPEPPEGVLEEGKQFAGFRCCDLLSRCDATRHIPIVLYSIVDKSHYEHRLRKLPEWVVYIPKDNLPLLCETIRQLTQHPRLARKEP